MTVHDAGMGVHAGLEYASYNAYIGLEQLDYRYKHRNEGSSFFIAHCEFYESGHTFA